MMTTGGGCRSWESFVFVLCVDSSEFRDVTQHRYTY